MEIRQLHQETIIDSEADEVARLKSLLDPRRAPGDPAISRQLAINELRPSARTFLFTYAGLFDGDRLAGLSETQGSMHGENDDACEVGIWVDPDYLGQGLHRRLFDHVDERERAIGRTRYWGWGNLDHEPTRTFWEDELGYTLAYDERISRCVLAEVDADLMQQWIDRAAERAHGYHLIAAQAPFSDEVIEYYAQGLEAMNDAPLDGLVHEHEVFDADRARDIEKLHLSIKSDYHALFAIETATDELAGFTALRIPQAEPELSRQGDTVTIAAHRNQGIGRWIKAEMWKWLRAEHPEVQSLDTGNAESNRPMLAINEAMGFRDILHHGVWQLAADTS